MGLLGVALAGWHVVERDQDQGKVKSDQNG